MSLLPCDIYDIRSGEPVLIGDIEAAKLWLVDNVDVWKGEKPDAVLAALQKLLDDTENVTGLNAEFYRGMVKAMIATYKAAKDVAAAIQAGIDYLVGEGLSEAEAKAEVEKVRGMLPKEEVKAEVPKEQPREKEFKERKTITSIKEAEDISDEVKKAFDQDRIVYEVLPNDVSVAEANAIVERVGIDGAREMVLGANKMPNAFRSTLAQVLMKQYNQRGEFDKALDIAQGIAEMATDWGQGIQALKLLNYLTPEGQLLFAKRNVDKMRKKKFEQHDKKIKKVKKAVDEATKEAAKEAVDKIQGRTPKASEVVQKSVLGDLAKKLRAAKINKARPGIFQSANPAAVAFDLAVETVALALDAGKTIEVAVREGIKAMSNTDWYKKLSGKEQKQAEADFRGFVEKEKPVDVGKEIAKASKDLQIKIGELIYKHYTEVDAAKTKIADKLVKDLGLSKEEALEIQKAVEVEFNRLFKEKQAEKLKKVFNPIERKRYNVKTLEQKIIELSNLGAFDEAALKEAYAKALGFPEITPENAAQIKKLAEKAQAAKEGLFKQRAMEDLLKYQQQLKGFDWMEAGISIHMAAILSGKSTQELNFLSNIFNLAFEIIATAGAQPKTLSGSLNALRFGLGKGWLEANDVLNTGYSPIKDKAQIPGILERKTFKGGKLNPFNYYKYVRRFMIASDVLIFEPLQEMRAYQMAFEKTGSHKEAIKLLYRTNDDAVMAQAEAKKELEERLENIKTNESLSEFEKRKESAKAEADAKRRVYEIMAQKRPQKLMEDAHSYAEKATFNSKPTGLIGWMAQKVNMATYEAPLLKFIIPFTNVPANVANNTLNYSPIGAIRALTKSGSITGLARSESFDLRDRKELMIKSAMGTSIAILAYVLSGIDDDDDEPLIEITANGFDDFGKNRELEATGWQPFSIKIGETWYSYKLTPLMPILASVGALRDMEKYKKEDVTPELLERWSGMFGNFLQATAKSTAFVESANTFLSSVLDSKNADGMIEGMIGWLEKTSASFVPVFGTNFYNQVADEFRDVFDMPDKQYYGEHFGRVLRNIPIARGLYNNYVNGLGEEINDKNSVFLSTKPEGQYTYLWELIGKNGTTTGQPSALQATIVENGEERGMTSDEYYTFCKYRGEFIRMAMESNYDYLAGLSKDDFQDEFSTIKAAATNIAKVLVLSPDAETYAEYKRTMASNRQEDENPNKLKQKKLIKEYLSK